MESQLDPSVQARMREDWNRRAREDASYYVAFGRRDQDDEEFFETAKEVVASVEWELRRLPRNANRRAWRALEIGCGPGRLLRPLSGIFGEIHGVDVSDEMTRLARAKLIGIPHAHVHCGDGASLAAFADESFDMVYSYAVFQHIPSRDVVLQYLREAQRVLKTGGLLRAQFNGLPQSVGQYDTWSGVRFTREELMEFTRESGFQVLAMEGAGTQYMWT
ncbi:MAG: class I SAM-dependent methyltransferase, partial [Bryobacteraceae bacterium]